MNDFEFVDAQKALYPIAMLDPPQSLSGGDTMGVFALGSSSQIASLSAAKCPSKPAIPPLFRYLV